MDKFKEIIENRIKILQDILGRSDNISCEISDNIKQSIENLTSLLNSQEVTEDAIYQASLSVDSILVQTMITGEGVFDSYENITRFIQRSLRGSQWAKDNNSPYQYILYTWADHIVFENNQYADGEYISKIYRADYTISGNEVTFSNFVEWSIEEVGVAVSKSLSMQSNKELDIIMQGNTIPEARIIETGGEAIFLQIMPGNIKLLQSDATSGRAVFSGIATHGNIPNSANIVYPTELWQSEITKAESLIAQGRLYGSLDHKFDANGKPRMPSPDELSHKFTQLKMVDDYMLFQAETLSTTPGRELYALLQDDIGLDMSTITKGKVKKGEWNGQSAYIVQEKGFGLIGIDVVLQGASPGSAITDVKLQSLSGAEREKETKMNREEIEQLIQAAMADGNGEKVQLLQTQLDALKGVLEQSQKEGLTEQDRELLQSARQTAIIQSRDQKVESVVTAMIDSKELPLQFKNSAIKMLQSLAATSELVEARVPELKDAMKDMIQFHAEAQTKGYYVPEYKSDGTKIEKVQSVSDAIEDLIHSKITQGKLPEDTGVKDPSNIVWSVRAMLQNMAQEKPETITGYMMLRNGDLKNPGQMENILHQSYADLVQAIPTGAMTTTDIATAIPYLMPIVTEFAPLLIANRYASMQPMTKSVGTIAYWKVADQDGNNIKEVANFTGSYANDPGEKETLKKLKGTLTTENITPETKKLGYDLSVEVIRRLRTDWGIDASSTMVSECAEEIAREWNYNHLQKMLDGATAGNWNYGTAIPSDSSFDGEQWQKQIITYLTFARSGIRKKTFAPTVAILGESDAIARITLLAKEVGKLSDAGTGTGAISQGVNIDGMLTTGEELVSVDWWESLGVPNKLLIIARGDRWYKSGFIIAPYLGLYVTPQWTDPDTLDVEQGMLSEMGNKMVNGNYFGTITIQEGTAGTPL